MDVLLFKKDLEKYPVKSLQQLQQHLGLPDVKNKEDLVWLLAVYQTNKNKKAYLPPVSAEGSILDDNTKVVDTADVKAYIEYLLLDQREFSVEKYIINKFHKCYHLLPLLYENHYGLAVLRATRDNLQRNRVLDALLSKRECLLINEITQAKLNPIKIFHRELEKLVGNTLSNSKIVNVDNKLYNSMGVAIYYAQQLLAPVSS